MYFHGGIELEAVYFRTTRLTFSDILYRQQLHQYKGCFATTGLLKGRTGHETLVLRNALVHERLACRTGHETPHNIVFLKMWQVMLN